MERTVSGEAWVKRGWTRVLNVLYETDVTIGISHVSVPEEVSESGYETVQSLPSDSALLTETDLTEDQAITELNHLLGEELVHFLRPFDDDSIVIYRLTEKGFRVAHELRRTEKEDQWRAESRQINIVLTVATGFLAATAVGQAILAYFNEQPPTNTWFAITYATVVVMTILLLLARSGGWGPDIWG
jgi:hypothetical protein